MNQVVKQSKVIPVLRTSPLGNKFRYSRYILVLLTKDKDFTDNFKV